MYGKCYFDGEMRICALCLQCEHCGWREVYPLDRHPSPATVVRARIRARIRACEHCGRTGFRMECRWAYEDPAATAAEAAEQAAAVNERIAAGTSGAKP